jgi:alpha-galactosidase
LPINFDSKTGIFHINTKNTSYIFRIIKEGYVFGGYWGASIDSLDPSRLWQTYPSGFSPNYPGSMHGNIGLDLYPSEYPVYGSGDFRSPAIQVEFPNGSRLLDLRYLSHSITAGDRTPQPGLPQLSGADETLEIVLFDPSTGLEVVVRYAVYEAEDCIARSTAIVNRTNQPLRILRALSASVDILNEDYQMMNLYGAHARERQIERQSIRHGINAIESSRGSSSHQQNPFMTIVSPETTEHSGAAYGFSLIYSGNFLANAELDQFDYVRLQMGINPFDFAWNLEPDQTFCTPEAVLTYSRQGLNRLSQNFHNVFRNHLGASLYRNQPRPIVINNWEATYFNYDEQKLMELIDSCEGLGIDTFVLDDGWFGHRDNDRSSLGDWFVNTKKLPHGLDPLIERCEKRGMKFGLWLEPEMISEDSELYAAHPDWCIRQKGRPYCRGRHQLVLDLSRTDVLDYLKEKLGSLIANHRISYIKWDMNRNITDAYSSALNPAQQPEIYHRYILNLYDLLDYLTTRFPNVLYEACSGGGGRFDPGILYYMPQIWTSDNTDAIERLKIQYGTSMVYPPSSMTSHVSVCPNHQVSRTTPFHTRGLVAMSTSFGYELNPLSLTEQEREDIKKQTSLYRRISDLIVEGDFYRLISPFTSERCAWMSVSKDKRRAFVVHIQTLCTSSKPNMRLKMAGLDPHESYYIEERDAVYSGGELMNAGIAISTHGDFKAYSFTLTQVPYNHSFDN